MDKLILDHIENLVILENDEDYIFDAQMTLARISNGLFWLNNSIAIAEKNVHKEAVKSNTLLIMFLESNKTSVVPGWLSCAFQWYAVSLYNYARLIGWLSTKDTKFSKNYVKRIFPRVVEYRHKIGAHFAITDPRNDNEADLIASVMTNIIYAHGFLRAGAMSEIITDNEGNEIRAKNKTSWSLTKTHLKAIPRYWPEGPIKSYESIKISAESTRTFAVDWSDE